MIISERASFYQFVQRIRFLFKKQLEVIRLDVYNYTGFLPGSREQGFTALQQANLENGYIDRTSFIFI